MTVQRSHAGRRALVTGANSDIGAAIARRLAADGAALVLHHHAAGDAARSLADELRAGGVDVSLVEEDFRAKGKVETFAEYLLAETGPIDIFVHVAALERRDAWTRAHGDHLLEHIAVNVEAFLAVAAELVPFMADRGWGRVVAIGSVMAHRPRAEALAYAATKAALSTSVRALAREVAGRGVTMNVVSPGAIEAGRAVERYRDPEFRAAVSAKIPAARSGTPDDVAGPVAFLCSEAAAYVTGIDLLVDGGWTIGDAPGSLPGDARR